MRALRVRLRFAVVAAAVVVAAVAVVVGTRSAGADGDRGDDAAQWRSWHERRAHRLVAVGRMREAVEEWAALSKLDPAEISWPANAAVACFDAAEEENRVLTSSDTLFRFAATMVRDAIARGGAHDPRVSYAVARMRFIEKRWNDAFEFFSAARRRGFDPVRADHWWFRAAVNRSSMLISEGQPDAAVVLLRAALSSVPVHPERLEALINLAAAHRNRNEFILVESVIRNEIFPTWPDAPKACDLLGQSFADQGRLDQAIEMFGRAVERADKVALGPASGPQVYMDAIHHLARTYLQKGELGEAQRYATEFSRLSSENLDSLYLLGSIAAAGGERAGMEEGAKILRRVARLDPNQDACRAKLVSILSQLGEEEESKKYKLELDEIQQRNRDRKK